MVLTNELNEENEITFKINNVGPIANAEFNINKINVIGGKNSTGKSTSSKLLYSFLRANTDDNQDLASTKLYDLLKKLVLRTRFLVRDMNIDDENFDQFNRLSSWIRRNRDADFDKLVSVFFDFQDLYNDIINSQRYLAQDLQLEEYQRLRESREKKKVEIARLEKDLASFNSTYGDINLAQNRLQERLKQINNLINESVEDEESSTKFLDMLSENKESIEQKLELVTELISKSDSYKKDINSLLMGIENIDSKLKDNQSNLEASRLQITFDEVYDYINKVNKKSDSFYEEVMKTLLSSEFDIIGPNDYTDVSLYGYYSGSPFGYDVNFNNYSFKTEGLLDINKVFYIDSFSIFDFKSYTGDPSSLLECDHSKSLQKALFETDYKYQMFDSDDEDYAILERVESMINDIVGGKIVQEEGSLKFVDNNNNFSCSMKNTASGVKQIAIIQTLINKKILKPNSFLILDEPEVNMHPEWQLKLARVLVVLAMKANIHIYINSHSPLFITCIQTFTRYYEIEEDVNYYLTVPSEEEDQSGRYNFIQVPNGNLELIFENLGQPYDFLEYVDVKIHHRNNGKK